MNNNLKEIILGSVKIAASYEKEKADLEDFLLSFLKNNDFLASTLDYIGINPKDFETNLSEINKIENDFIGEKIDEKNIEEGMDKLLGALSENIFQAFGGEQNMTPFDQNKTSTQKNTKKDSNTPALDFFSTDFVEEAKKKKLDKVIGREQEIERLIAILNRKTKNNPVLV